MALVFGTIAIAAETPAPGTPPSGLPAATPAQGAPNAPDEDKSPQAQPIAWFLLPEPKFMGHGVTQAIAGAKHTVLAVARDGGYGLEFARKPEWDALALSPEAIAAATRLRAAEWLKQLTPEYTRDGQRVVQFATLRSNRVPVAATVLAPEFWKQFEEVFGPKMRVVIPNRHTLFIFPDLEGDLDRYARVVLEAWRSSAPKASLEVFELTEKGLKAIGSFEEP